MLRYIALAFLGAFVVSEACTCMPKQSLDYNYCHYDVVLKVKVGKEAMVDPMRKVYDIEVKDVFKGDKNDTRSKIFTASQSAACGVTLEKGAEYLIFANGKDKEGYSVISCSFPTKWSEVPKEDQEKLEKGQFPPCPASTPTPK